MNAPDSAPERDSSALGLALALLVGMAGYFFLQGPRLLEVWTGGGFFDTDDATRMVQVRDLMAGQAWFDLTAWRIDPPGGMVSHWSRLIDAPVVALVALFRLFLDPVHAERAARIAFPALVMLGLYGAGAHAGRVFCGRGARALGVIAMLLCGVMFWQFTPGRVDHHSAQIVTLVMALAFMAEAFDPARAFRAAALSGLALAVGLAIGVENLPFQAALVAAPALAYILRGAEARNLLLGFATGLAFALLAAYALTIGPARWTISACDALSFVYLAAALAGCAGFGALALFGGRLPLSGRIAATSVAGAAALAPVLLIAPVCIVDPFHGLDPLVRALWLDHNGEIISIFEEYRIEPGTAVMMAVPIVFGLLGALFGVAQGARVARARWLLLAVQIALGLTLGSLHVRVFSTAMPLAALGLLAPAEALRRRLAESAGAFASSFAGFAALVMFSSVGVAIASPDLKVAPEVENTAARAWRRPDVCLDSASYEPLAALAPGLAVTQIPTGAYLLAHTSLSVLAAPYHRDAGNRAALDILRASPAAAEQLVRRAHARYVILCWGKAAEDAALRELSAGGLAAQLMDGRTPEWLRTVKVEGMAFHVYEVMAPRD